jgi:hypothetical protein
MFALPAHTLGYAFTGGYYSQAEIGNYALSVCFEQGYAYNNRVVIEHGLERAEQGINNLNWVISAGLSKLARPPRGLPRYRDSGDVHL